MIRSLAAAALALPLLASCATGPEPCTAAWVDWKTERIMAQFAMDHRSDIANIKQLAPAMAGSSLGGSTPVHRLILTGIGMLDLVGDFTSETWPRIADAVSECSAPPDATRLFADMLRRENVDESIVRGVESLGNLVDFRR